MIVVLWCNRLIRLGFLLLFILIPLVLTPWNYELFEYNKMMTVYALTVLIVGCWIVKMVKERRIRVTKTPLDIPIILFFLSQFISSLFSLDAHISWLGYYSRFNGGMWSIVSYILLFYAFISNLMPQKSNNSDAQVPVSKKHSLLSSVSILSAKTAPILKTALVSAVVIALYAIAQRLGVDKHIWVQDVQNRVFSTLGQPNWLAAYLVSLFPIALAFTLGAQIRKRSLGAILWGCVTSLFFIVLLFTRSRSGMLGFVVADLVFWGVLFLKVSEKKSYIPKVAALHVLLFLAVFFIGSTIDSYDRYFTLQGWVRILTKSKIETPAPVRPTGPMLEVGGTESSTIRKYVWQGATQAWRSSVKTILIGTGTETFAFAFYQYRPKEHNLTSEWDFLYNKAHNEYLNYLATTGILGLGTYILFLGASALVFINALKTPSFIRNAATVRNNRQLSVETAGSTETGLINTALLAGWSSVLVTNFFGFSVVIMQLILFLWPAIAYASSRTETSVRQYDKPLRFSEKTGKYIIIILCVIPLYLFYVLTKFWFADTLYAKGYRNNKSGQFAVALKPLEQAIRLNPKEPLYHDELGEVTGALALLALENRDATTAAALAKESLAQSDMALSISPKNVNFWKTRTKIYYSFSTFDPQFNQAAITALEQAQLLSPNDPKIHYNLAILYGRQPNNEKAIELLKLAIALKPNYRDAYYALSIFYKEVNQPELARMTLREYLDRVDPNDAEFHKTLEQ